MLGYTGTYKGKPISVQSVGMGGASVAIYYTELAQQLGATRLVRVGTAGGIGDRHADGRHRRRGQRHVRRPDDRHPHRRRSHAPTADWRARRARRCGLARESSATDARRPIVTSAIFYDPREGIMERWRARGHLAIEMEAAILYTLGAIHGFESLAIMTISDMIGRDGESERISDDELKRGVDQMMEIGCEVAIADL